MLSDQDWYTNKWVDAALNSLASIYSARGVKRSCIVDKNNVRSDFPNQWNNMNNMDIGVIMLHGSAQRISVLGVRVTDETINSLEKINVKLLIILSCNAGHYSYEWSNIAYKFAFKITGTVIASDGTVGLLKYSNIPYLTVSSDNDTAWANLNRTYRANNWGWVIYRVVSEKIRWYSTSLPTEVKGLGTFVTYVRNVGWF